MKGILFGVVTVGIALFFSLIGFLIPSIPAVVAIALPILFSIGFAIVAMTALSPKAPPLPATAKGDAVRLVAFNANTSTLFCTSLNWGAEFAQMNGIVSQPKSRGNWFGAGGLGTAIILAPIVAGVAWFMGHPQVHFDNAGEQAVQIWIDGKKGPVVKPDGNESAFVGHGKHTFGWSPEGASAPQETNDGNVTINDAHLYNPGETACYWLVADSYGNASVMGMQRGPQPIQPFYTFDKVDTWFAENPQSITVDSNSGQQGGTRVALQRANACMYLAKHGCDVAARDKFIECEKGVSDDDGLKKCEDAVACGDVNKGEAGGKSATPAAAKGPGHAAPHSGPHPTSGSGHAAPKPSK
jgi:hypothetical protein